MVVRRAYTADFETTTDPDDCRVWAWGTCEIDNFSNFEYGNTLDGFMEWCKDKGNAVVLFHNLKFDGEFIIWWLTEHGYEHIADKKEKQDFTFSTLITDMGVFYEIEVYFKVNKKHTIKVTFQDSLKILNFSVEKIAKDFNLPIRKGHIDYDAYRAVGHILTEEELSYLKNDVEIVARALNFMYSEDMKKMTIGSDALCFYKKLTPNFNKLFPVLDPAVDADIRQSYRGGFTYVNPVWQGKDTGHIMVVDKNSMYPSMMKFKSFPVGEPLYFDGKYQPDSMYPLYVQMICCSFEVKKNKLPTIQIKNNVFGRYKPNEYITSSHGEVETLCLTSPDLELFLENYDVQELEYISGWKFKAMAGETLFGEYIDHWTEQKIKAKKEGNKSMYALSKLCLNSLYGKFGTALSGRKKTPVLCHDDVVRYEIGEREEKKGIYLPVATFCTAYARCDIIRTSQKISDYTRSKYGYDGVVYHDTDSCHVQLEMDFLGFDEKGETKFKLKEEDEILKDIINIDPYKLNYWDIECYDENARYLHQKCYIHKSFNGEISSTIAGLPKKLGHLPNFDNFKQGFTTAMFSDEEIGEGGRKMMFKHVKGGVILTETDFTIK